MDPTRDEESSQSHDPNTHQDSTANERPGTPPSTVPPYWQHRRLVSYASVNNPKPAPIILEDHTEETSEQTGLLWAKGVSIDDYVIIQGNVPSLGDYTVWNCKIDTLDVSFCFLILPIPSSILYDSVLCGLHVYLYLIWVGNAF